MPAGLIATISLACLTALLSTGCTASRPSPKGPNAAASTGRKAVPLAVLSVSPSAGAAGTNGSAPIVVTYNQPLPAGTAFPVLAPALAGSWARDGHTAVFTPATGYPAKTKVTISFPAGKAAAGAQPAATPGSPAAGTGAAHAATTTATTSFTFTTGQYSVLRLQEVLAELHYLPLTWAQSSGPQDPVIPSPPKGPTPGPSTPPASQPAQPVPPPSGKPSPTVSGEPMPTQPAAGQQGQGKQAPAEQAPAPAAQAPAGQASAAAFDAPLGAREELSQAYQPPSGSFTWDGGYPSQIKSFWTPGVMNTLTRGAITGFEADHKLATDGRASAAVWAAVLTAAAAGQVNTHGYSYAVADQHSPETLTIWHNGKLAFKNAANTGIGVAPTPVGTFPVYERLPFQVMSGTNPDGSHYADPVKWVSYFSGGAAVHYFLRGSYGWRQSLGCVELPYDAAEQAYPLLPYGTLVTVTSA